MLRSKALAVLAGAVALVVALPASASPPEEPSPHPAPPVGAGAARATSADAYFFERVSVSDSEWQETWTSLWFSEWNGEAWVSLYRDVIRCSDDTCEWVESQDGWAELEADEYEASPTLDSVSLDTVVWLHSYDAGWGVASAGTSRLTAEWAAGEPIRLDGVSQHAWIGECWAVAAAGAGVRRSATVEGTLGGADLGEGGGDMYSSVDGGAFVGCLSG